MLNKALLSIRERLDNRILMSKECMCESAKKDAVYNMYLNADRLRESDGFILRGHDKYKESAVFPSDAMRVMSSSFAFRGN